MIIATRCLDFFFFFNEDNRRYTIGTFSGIGHYRGTIYKFDYKVGDSIFIVDTSVTFPSPCASSFSSCAASPG